MKTLFNLCLSLALSIGLFNYGFSQAAASSENVTPPLSTENMSNQNQYVEADESLGDEALDKYGLELPRSIDWKITSGDANGAWEEFEKFTKDLGKDKRAQVLESTVMMCNKLMVIGDREKWIAKRTEAQQTLLKEFPKWSETYNCLITLETPPAQVIEYTTKGIQCDPKNYRMYERRGRAYLQLRKTKEACEDFDKCPDKSRIWEYESTCKKQE